MRLSGGRLPPTNGIDKWHYPQGKIVINASDREELTRRIFEFRLRNGIPIGNIEQDIDRYYCDRWPGFCTEERRDRNPNAPWEPKESMLNRVSRWAAATIHAMPKGGYALVTAAEAERRAAICVQCTKNTGWRGGCGGCSASTLQLLMQIKQLRKTTRDGSLTGCSVGGWENSSAAWLPPEALPVTEEQRTTMPAACWRKQIP